MVGKLAEIRRCGSRTFPAYAESRPDCRFRRTPPPTGRESSRAASVGRRPRSASAGRGSLPHADRRRSMAGDALAKYRPAGRDRADRRGRESRRRPAAALRPARAACRAERRGQTRTVRGRPTARCPDRGRCGDAGNRRPSTINSAWNVRIASCAAATRSAFCTCGTSGNSHRSSRASSFSSPLLRAISAADDRHANAARVEPRGEPLDQRRLAGAAEGEIAHAHHRHADAMDRGRAAVVAAVSPAGRRPHRSTRRAATRRAGGRPGAAPPSAHKFSKPRCIQQGRLRS